MTLDQATIIRVLDGSRGKFEEQAVQPQQQWLDEALIPYPRDGRGRMTVDHEKVALTESSTGGLSTANFPDLLRMGVQFDVFSGFNEFPVTWPQFCMQMTSNKDKEEYLKDAALGIAPIVEEGQPYPRAAVNLNDGVIIGNHKRGYLIPVTEEMQKFDQLGKVRDLANQIGRSLRLTEEQAVMDVLTTTGNYTRNSTTNDNDEGANTQNLTFSPDGLVTAFNVLGTMKDRQTGVKLGVRPNTLVIGPKLAWAAKQLIMSPNLMQVGDPGTAATLYGGGTMNPFFNVVDTIIVSPYFGSSYQWALLERNRSIVFQRVEPIQILIEGMNAATSSYIQRDVIHYRGRTWFGVGMKDDRFAFFSNSTTKPVIN